MSDISDPPSHVGGPLRTKSSASWAGSIRNVLVYSFCCLQGLRGTMWSLIPPTWTGDPFAPTGPRLKGDTV